MASRTPRWSPSRPALTARRAGAGATQWRRSSASSRWTNGRAARRSAVADADGHLSVGHLGASPPGWGAESPSELSGGPLRPATISRRPCSSSSVTPVSRLLIDLAFEPLRDRRSGNAASRVEAGQPTFAALHHSEHAVDPEQQRAEPTPVHPPRPRFTAVHGQTQAGCIFAPHRRHVLRTTANFFALERQMKSESLVYIEHDAR